MGEGKDASKTVVRGHGPMVGAQATVPTTVKRNGKLWISVSSHIPTLYSGKLAAIMLRLNIQPQSRQ